MNILVMFNFLDLFLFIVVVVVGATSFGTSFFNFCIAYSNGSVVVLLMIMFSVVFCVCIVILFGMVIFVSVFVNIFVLMMFYMFFASRRFFNFKRVALKMDIKFFSCILCRVMLEIVCV